MICEINKVFSQLFDFIALYIIFQRTWAIQKTSINNSLTIEWIIHLLVVIHLYFP
jgi:hypothetical protein